MLKTKETTKTKIKSPVIEKKTSNSNSNLLLGFLGLGLIALTANAETSSEPAFKVIDGLKLVEFSNLITYSMEVLINNKPTIISFNENEIVIQSSDLSFIDIDTFLDQQNKLQEHFGIDNKEQAIELFEFIEHHDPFEGSFDYSNLKDLKTKKTFDALTISCLINGELVLIKQDIRGYITSIVVKNHTYIIFGPDPAEQITKILYVSKVIDKHYSHLGHCLIDKMLPSAPMSFISIFDSPLPPKG